MIIESLSWLIYLKFASTYASVIFVYASVIFGYSSTIKASFEFSHVLVISVNLTPFIGDMFGSSVFSCPSRFYPLFSTQDLCWH